MRDSRYHISLDMHDVASQVQITAKKDDNMRTLYITLTENGQPYIPERGCSAVIMIKKPDDTILNNDCDIRLTDGVIIYEFTQQTVAVEGLCECELRLYGTDNDEITSPRFTLRVNSVVFDDGQTESQSEFTTLLQAISETNNLGVSVSKVGAVTTLTVTKKDGTTESVTITDAADIETLMQMLGAKADKVSGAGHNGHLAALNSSGNLTDSNIASENVEQKTNKVTDWSASPSDQKYPSEKLVRDALDEVIETAEGRTKTYIISTDDNPTFDDQEGIVTVPGDLIDINGETVLLSSLKSGDIILVTETDCPDRWFAGAEGGSGYYYRLETQKIDINLYQLKADRVTNWSETPSNTKYPSEKLVKDNLDLKAPSDLFTMGTTDIGEGADLATGHFYAVYE